MGKVKILIVAVIIAAVSKVLYDAFKDFELSTDTPAEEFWGPKSLQSAKEDTKIYPFKVEVSDDVLTDLKSKLNEEINSKRFIAPLEGIGSQYGFNTNYIQKVIKYWHTQYDWRAREKLLNKYPHFKTKISGIGIHFQHVKSQNNSKYKKTLPLLLLHGWPGSFAEFQKTIPLLTDPKDSDFNFELIIPSLPGYGFSQASVRPGLDAIGASRMFVKLMKRLSHDKFYVQGGDWGSIIGTHIVIALHSNMCMSMHPRSHLRALIASIFPSWVLSPKEISRYMSFSDHFKFIIRETGYAHIQATKPDTLGTGLSHSPSGLAAYILEKFATWTDPAGDDAEDGLLTKHFTLDELLDNIMIYWVTNSITTTMRLYAESITAAGTDIDRAPIQVPVGCLVTLDRCTNQGKWIMEDKFPNMVHYELTDQGGHFLALEKPNLLAVDVLNFIKKLNKS